MKLYTSVLRTLFYRFTPKKISGDIFLSSNIENTENLKNTRYTKIDPTTMF